MMKRHALYRFFNTDGDLLYIGITIDPGSRWKGHAADKKWWHEVTTITLEHHPSRVAVEAAEIAAIQTEHPRYNIRHNDTPAPPRLRAQDMPDDCDICGENEISSVYYPRLWDTTGLARYRCAYGHRWSCGWPAPPDAQAGYAPENDGVRQVEDREELTPRQVAHIERVLATPGHYGRVL